MAVACSQLLAAPEEHVRNLRALLALTVDDDVQVLAESEPILFTYPRLEVIRQQLGVGTGCASASECCFWEVSSLKCQDG
jgi:hypothetical protein